MHAKRGNPIVAPHNSWLCRINQKGIVERGNPIVERGNPIVDN
jgi:hypothetical protein